MADTISTSATIDYSDQSGNKGQKSLTDINPNATNQQIRALAVAMNNLTTNTLTGVNKITKTKISSVAKTEATLNYSGQNTGTVSAAEIIAAGGKKTDASSNNVAGRVVLTHNDTAFPVTFTRKAHATAALASVQIYIGTLNETLRTSITNTEGTSNYVNGDPEKRVSLTGTIKFYIEEDDTYTRSPELTLTITD